MARLTVIRLGDGLGIKIPDHIAEATNLVEGDSLELDTEGDGLALRRKLRIPRYRFHEVKDCFHCAEDEEYGDAGEHAGREKS